MGLFAHHGHDGGCAAATHADKGLVIVFVCPKRNTHVF